MPTTVPQWCSDVLMMPTTVVLWCVDDAYDSPTVVLWCVDDAYDSGALMCWWCLRQSHSGALMCWWCLRQWCSDVLMMPTTVPQWCSDVLMMSTTVVLWCVDDVYDSGALMCWWCLRQWCSDVLMMPTTVVLWCVDDAYDGGALLCWWCLRQWCAACAGKMKTASAHGGINLQNQNLLMDTVNHVMEQIRIDAKTGQLNSMMAEQALIFDDEILIEDEVAQFTCEPGSLLKGQQCGTWSDCQGDSTVVHRLAIRGPRLWYRYFAKLSHFFYFFITVSTRYSKK